MVGSFVRTLPARHPSALRNRARGNPSGEGATPRAAEAQLPSPTSPCRAADRPAAGGVAVVIPTYNYARFLETALQSVYAQTVPPAEIIVVDDGSTDDPASQLAAHPRVRLIRQLHQGLGAARNVGWRAAESDFVVFLDADDQLRPQAIELHLQQFAARPECGLVYAAYCGVRAGTATPVAVQLPGPDAVATLLRGNMIAMHGAVMYRRDVLDELGGFDPNLPACEDYDLYLRTALRYPISCRPEIVADYIRHERNMSRDAAMMLQSALSVLDRFAHRARTRPRWRRALRCGRAHLLETYVSLWVYAFRRSRGTPEEPELRRQGLKIVSIAPLTLARVVIGQSRAAVLRRLRRAPRSAA